MGVLLFTLDTQMFFYGTQFLYKMNKAQDSCHVMLEADELYVVT